jgi:hypothetical protein
MTDQEINVAIAEACGWTSRVNADGDLTESHLTRTWTEWFGPNNVVDLSPPNYCADLNAMHEAEVSIPSGKLGYYNAELSKIACKRTLSSAVKEPDFIFMLLHATARQRAEAFLRTLGKWQDTPQPQTADTLT